MTAVTQVVESLIAWLLPLVGFYVASRKPGHTRAQLVAGATLAGGVAGAIVAAVATIAGASFLYVLPTALVGLVRGAIIGFVGIRAFAIGRWLSHRP